MLTAIAVCVAFVAYHQLEVALAAARVAIWAAVR